MGERALVVVVNGLDEATRAAAIAQGLGVSLTLLSAPGAGGFGGCGWFGAVAAATGAAFPDLTIAWALDCADRTGDAMEALAAGCPLAIFTGGAAAAARLAAVAAARGAALRRSRPDGLVLRASGDPMAAARDWLSRPC